MPRAALGLPTMRARETRTNVQALHGPLHRGGQNLFQDRRPGLGVARFRRPSVRPCPAKPEFCVKNQAESADDGGGCESALNGPIDTPDPRQAQPSHHGGEEKQQIHGGLFGTKLKD